MPVHAINVLDCVPGQSSGWIVTGQKGNSCQIFLVSGETYTYVCHVPRRIGEASLARVERYCRDLSRPPYLDVLTSSSFWIGFYGAIVFYLFMRWLINQPLGTAPSTSLGTGRGKSPGGGSRNAGISEDVPKSPSKRHLTYPPIANPKP